MLSKVLKGQAQTDPGDDLGHYGRLHEAAATDFFDATAYRSGEVSRCSNKSVPSKPKCAAVKRDAFEAGREAGEQQARDALKPVTGAAERIDRGYCQHAAASCAGWRRKMQWNYLSGLPGVYCIAN